MTRETRDNRRDLGLKTSFSVSSSGGGDKADITQAQLYKFLLIFFLKNYYMIKTNFGSFHITLSKVWKEAKHLDIFFSGKLVRDNFFW